MYHKLYIEGQSKNRRIHGKSVSAFESGSFENSSVQCKSAVSYFSTLWGKGYDHMLRQDVQFSGRTDFIRANSGKI